MHLSLKLAFASSALLAACATPPQPPEAAALEFSPSAECTDQFASATAVDMTPEEPEGFTVRRSVLDASSACVTLDGAATPYALFKLPTLANSASVQAGAIFEPVRVLGAKVHFLDADLKPTRSYDASDMLHRGTTLSVLVRPRTDEHYVAIVADASLANSGYNRSRPPEGNSRATDRVAYSLLGRSFVRVYYHDPAKLGSES